MVRTRRRERDCDDVQLRIHAWPLELVNGRPQDPEVTAEHVEELRAQISTDLFEGFDQSRFPTTTLPALALAACAYKHSASTGEDISFTLRDALFEEGRDISDPSVLADIASDHGIEADQATYRDDVWRDWHAGQARGVKGSPHFFCGQNASFVLR